jgi:hypothetical protein
VKPAALLAGLGEHLAQRTPEPQRPVPGREHRGAHAAARAVAARAVAEQVREPAMEASGAIWRTSSHSTQDGNCVEVAAVPSGEIAVRESKNRPGPSLVLARQQWRRNRAMDASALRSSCGRAAR